MNIYQAIYDLINGYVFGGTVAVETYPDLVCIALSTMACIFVMALPFVLVWRCIKMWF